MKKQIKYRWTLTCASASMESKATSVRQCIRHARRAMRTECDGLEEAIICVEEKDKRLGWVVIRLDSRDASGKYTIVKQ